MNILITGGNGFVGKNLIKKLKTKHQIFSPTSKELDLTDSVKVDEYLRNKYFDYVIHCAVSGGRRNKVDSPYTTYDNLLMFFNLLKNQDRFGKLINFASGAEFDRRTEINSTKNHLQNSFPVDYYGLSKNVISRIIENIDNYYNFRIYGVFGINEGEDRFIKANILKYKQKEDLIIHQDKFFDFIFIEDLVNIVEYYINNPKSYPGPTDLVYQHKIKLSDIAKLINGLSPHKSEIIIKEDSLGLSYTGSNIGIKIPFELIGLKEGIKKVYSAL
jgi:nucleoside-diphosphate-sugar epimerase